MLGTVVFRPRWCLQARAIIWPWLNMALTVLHSLDSGLAHLISRTAHPKPAETALCVSVVGSAGEGARGRLVPRIMPSDQKPDTRWIQWASPRRRAATRTSSSGTNRHSIRSTDALSTANRRHILSTDALSTANRRSI